MNPRYALARHWYGEFLKLRGEHEASIAQLREAIKEDPFSIPIRYDLVLALLEARRVTEARTILETMRDIDPNAARVARAESDVLEAEGRPQQAMEARFRAELLSGVSEADVDGLRAAYRAGGAPAVYRKMLTATAPSEKPGITPLRFVASRRADLYARLGDRKNTLAWLEKSADRREDAALLLLTHTYDFLHDDPEFVALETRVGLRR